MKIPKVSLSVYPKIKQSAKVAIGTILLSFNTQCTKDELVKTFTNESKPIIAKLETKLSSAFSQGLQITENVNARGGHTKCFNDSSLAVLRQRLVDSGLKNTYVFPIDSAIKPYIPSTGQFGSIRPAGRPHLGVDIYPVLYGRKPKKPVAVVAATDGIVVSVKKSPQKDPKNLIANNIKIMASDGKIYNYDHLGRIEDYTGAKYFNLKELGEVVHAGDTLGTVGRTGETAVWHLHFGVSDLNVQKAQLENSFWQKLLKKHSVYATPTGQVDPLDSIKVGDIAKVLNKYKIDKGEKVSYLKDL